MTDKGETLEEKKSNFDTSIDDSKLCQLIEMFPEMDTETITNALRSSKNNLDLAISFLLSDVASDTNIKSISDDDENIKTPKLVDLYEMFPKINSNIIRSYYNSHERDVKRTIVALLDYELLSAEDINDQKRVERRIKNTIEDGNVNSWKSYNEKINLILKFTEVDAVSAKRYYQQNHMNPLMAIIYIIQKNIKSEQTIRPATSPATTGSTRTQLGGRVQSVNGFAYKPKIFDEDKEPPCSVSGVDINARPWSNREKFVYSKSSSEIVELGNLISSNVDFRSINPVFVTHAIKYYNGCVAQTVDLLILLCSNKCSKFTFINEDTNSDFIETNSWRSKSSTKAPRGSYKTISNDIKQKYEPQSQKIDINYTLDHLFENYRLDFHGLLPSQAVEILSRALTKWWNAEVEERELRRKRLNLVNVCCVNPLIVITGRGIHSVGGISKVRIQVKKFLENKNYVFDEEPSFFTVYGKRPS
ncbi:similar to Saccharomyces cerevisiae YKL090W CUE2 Protein of unknown function [Maudiozyma saulgeensis]|uniref:Smr domain-containing protein n=1 Tax=Maudiozyma saulgeensis TaxID=1789683 RepID=A0A1X7R0B3_9SACH|nr:similar to Saccharomyces cerevisiae YKL090W CUE2 Protein of unknown function [Kazachstania saulgeensis]